MMLTSPELPESALERVKIMEEILIAASTGGDIDDDTYTVLRRELMHDHEIRSMVPDFVLNYRNLDAFWPYIKNAAPSYSERRQLIRTAFNPLVDHLEDVHRTPGDLVIFDTIESLDAEHIHSLWAKALARRQADPDGAITLARTLLEAVTKHILDDLSIDYRDKEDLPSLYGKVAHALSLAPNQHSEEPIKAILGGIMNLVNGLGTLRNRLSDSHGRGRKLAVRPSARHASLAVNAAGSVAAFLVETYREKHK